MTYTVHTATTVRVFTSYSEADAHRHQLVLQGTFAWIT